MRELTRHPACDRIGHGRGAFDGRLAGFRGRVSGAVVGLGDSSAASSTVRSPARRPSASGRDAHRICLIPKKFTKRARVASTPTSEWPNTRFVLTGEIAPGEIAYGADAPPAVSPGAVSPAAQAQHVGPARGGPRITTLIDAFGR